MFEDIVYNFGKEYLCALKREKESESYELDILLH